MKQNRSSQTTGLPFQGRAECQRFCKGHNLLVKLAARQVHSGDTELLRHTVVRHKLARQLAAGLDAAGVVHVRVVVGVAAGVQQQISSDLRRQQGS